MTDEGEADYKVEPQSYFEVKLNDDLNNICSVDKKFFFIGTHPIAHGGRSDFAETFPDLLIDKLLLYHTNEKFINKILDYLHRK